MSFLKNIFGDDAFLQVNYHLIRKLESVEKSVLLSELVSKFFYHLDRGETVSKDGKEWFFFKTSDVEEKFFMSHKVQSKIIDDLSELCLIEKCLIGVPAKRHFTVNIENIELLMGKTSFAQREKLESPKWINKNIQKGESLYNNDNNIKYNKEARAKKKSFIAPSEQEVVNYFKEKGYSEESAKKAFEYYETGEWKDSKGTPVKNWKQKMISVWFKEENKSKEVTQNKLVF